MKKFMKAPPGVTSITIEGGHEYKVGKDGVIQLISDTHIHPLTMHGFVDHTPDEEVDPDTMSKSQLVEFLEERGEDTDGLSEKKLRKRAHEILQG